jgi:hypothetical protein
MDIITSKIKNLNLGMLGLPRLGVLGSATLIQVMQGIGNYTIRRAIFS